MIQKKQNKIFKNELKKFKVKNLNLYLNRNKNKKSLKKFEEKFLIKVLKKIGKKDNNYFTFFEVCLFDKKDSFENYKTVYDFSNKHKENYKKHLINFENDIQEELKIDYDNLLLLYDDNFNYLNNNSCICKGGLVSLHSHLKEKLYKRCEKFMEKFIPRIFKNEIIRQEKEEFVNNNKVYTLDLEEKTYGFDDKNNLIRVFLSNIIYKKIEIDMVKYTNKFKNSTFCKQKRKSEYCSYIISNNETAKLIKMNNLIKDFFIYEESYTIVKNFINWYFYKKLKPELLLFLKNNNIHKNKGI